MLNVVDLGRLPYAAAYEEQVHRRDALIATRQIGDDAGASGVETGSRAGAAMTLLLVEHDPPVITVSRRPGASGNLVASPAQLARLGIEVRETDRGGDITYHGPGQLVAYPILDLQRLNLGVAAYLRWLEQIVIDTLAHWGIASHRDACATGVWVQVDGHGATASHEKPSVAAERAAGRNGSTSAAARDACNLSPGSAKICAMGIRVAKWVTMHGLALNVATDLSHFDAIVPCGIPGRAVTSMKALLGARAPSVDEVKPALAREFQRTIERTLAPVA